MEKYQGPEGSWNMTTSRPAPKKSLEHQFRRAELFEVL